MDAVKLPPERTCGSASTFPPGGVAGTVAGVTGAAGVAMFDGADGLDVPAAFVAVTVNV
jgi:hypothetical protein